MDRKSCTVEDGMIFAKNKRKWVWFKERKCLIEHDNSVSMQVGDKHMVGLDNITDVSDSYEQASEECQNRIKMYYSS